MTYEDIRKVLWESKSVRITLASDLVVEGVVMTIANGWREPGWVKIDGVTVQIDSIKAIEAI